MSTFAGQSFLLSEIVNDMQKSQETEFYTSPKAKVVEIKARQIVCLSNQPTGTFGLMESTDGSW